MELAPNDERHGTMHIWTGAHTGGYRKYIPRFSSEFGHQAPPTWATLARAIPEDARFIDSPQMMAHQKAGGGNEARLHAPLRDFFEMPASFDDWHSLTMLMQARSIQAGVEWWRSREGRCMGSLFWQLNDCWPVSSWAVIDGDARPKLLWYAAKRFYAPRLLTIQPLDSANETRLALYAHNDSRHVWQCSATLQRLNFDGRVLDELRAGRDLAPGQSLKLCDVPTDFAPRDKSREFLLAQGHGADNGRATWFYLPDKELRYPTPDFEAKLESKDGEYHFAIRAKSLLRDACCFAGRFDPQAQIEEQLATLLPGDEFTFVIRSQEAMDVESLTGRPFFWCANWFGHGGQVG